MRTIVCANKECGVEFGIPDHIYAQACNHADRAMVCPNGHRSFYLESAADKLKKQVDRLESDVARFRGYTADRDVRISRMERTIAYWKSRAHRGRARA
jgi:hypothetical protein